MYSFNYAIYNKNVCNNRTGKNSKFIFHEDKSIIKGPFSLDFKNKIEKYSAILKKWGVDNFIYPSYYYDMKDPIDDYYMKKGYFIKYPNINTNKYCEIKPKYDNFNNVKYNKIEQDDVKTLTEHGLEDWICDLIPDLTFTLICLKILKIANISTDNILLNIKEKKAYISTSFKTVNYEFEPIESFYLSKVKTEFFTEWKSYLKSSYFTISCKIKNLNTQGLTDILDVETISRHLLRLKKYNICRHDLKFIGVSGNGYIEHINSSIETDVKLLKCLKNYMYNNMPDKAVYCALKLYNNRNPDLRKTINKFAHKYIMCANLDLYIYLICCLINDYHIISYYINEVCMSLKTELPMQLKFCFFTLEHHSLADTLTERDKTWINSYKLHLHKNSIKSLTQLCDGGVNCRINIDIRTDAGYNKVNYLLSDINVKFFLNKKYKSEINVAKLPLKTQQLIRYITTYVDENDLETIGYIFYRRLLQKDIKCIYWLKKYISKTKDRSVIFNYLGKLLPEYIFKTLFAAVSQFQDNVLIIINAIIIIVYDIRAKGIKYLNNLVINMDDFLSEDEIISVDDKYEYRKSDIICDEYIELLYKMYNL